MRQRHKERKIKGLREQKRQRHIQVQNQSYINSKTEREINRCTDIKRYKIENER